MRPQEPVRIVSLGTGELNKRLRWEDASTWGSVRWARPIIDMFFDASSAIVQEQLTRMLGERNHRFQIPLTGCTEAMDDASPRNLAALRRNAELLIEQRHDELSALAEELQPERNPPLTATAAAATGAGPGSAGRIPARLWSARPTPVEPGDPSGTLSYRCPSSQLPPPQSPSPRRSRCRTSASAWCGARARGGRCC